jgi:hypothetical protein
MSSPLIRRQGAICLPHVQSAAWEIVSVSKLCLRASRNNLQSRIAANSQSRIAGGACQDLLLSRTRITVATAARVEAGSETQCRRGSMATEE